MQAEKIRIYQIAHEVQLDSGTVVDLCQQLQLGSKTASSTVTLAEADQIRAAALNSNGKRATPEPIAAADPPPGDPDAIDLEDPQYYINRELSWLKFNQRVLHEALDLRTPLLERLKFLAIFCSNLDEYFMVRVAGLKQLVDAGVTKRSLDGLTASEQLIAIRHELEPDVIRQHQYFSQDLRPQLATEGIYLLDYADLSDKQTAHLRLYFLEQIYPVLTPLAVDPGHPFPYISNLSLNLAVVVQDAQSGTSHFARVKVPHMLPRFITLPETTWDQANCYQWCAVPIEQVIAHNIETLFVGMTIVACYPFRITRNADLELEEDEADDLLLAIEEELRKRRFGSVVRMEIQVGTPDFIRQRLMRELLLERNDVYTVEGILGLKDLFSLSGLPFPHLQNSPWIPMVPVRLRQHEPLEKPLEDNQVDIFGVMRDRDLLVHHPYDSFTATVQRFITQAAHDPNVLTIKMTLYRTAGDSRMVGSPIISSLIAAAENGKQVVVLVELKARFDEENNIIWARKLEQVGVHVVYGLVGLKTHTKIALVVRRERDRIRRYVHIGTGNYNPKTARIYTDFGLLSCCDDLGADLTDLFNYLTGYSRHQSYRKLLIAPINLRQRILALIMREIEHQHQGGHGRIIAKMNSLIDKQIIMALYQASQAGVQIDLIIRGICSLRPGIKGISDNIRVISIIGQFLEHDRIFYFHNHNDPTVLIGSADWRTRNLDRRVEAVVPLTDSEIARHLYDLLQLMLADNRQAWDLQENGQYIQRHSVEDEPERGTHNLLMQQALNISH